MKKYLSLLLAVVVCGCLYITDGANSAVVLTELANNFSITSPDPLFAHTVETAGLYDSASERMDLWYQDDSGGTNHIVKYTYADNADCSNWSAGQTISVDCRYPSVVKFNGFWYLFGRTSVADKSIYGWKSSDRVNWSALNGGNPVITKAVTSGVSYYENMYNLNVYVGTDNVWHGFVEGLKTGGDLARDGGIMYTSGVLIGDNLDLDTGRKPTPTFHLKEWNPYASDTDRKSSFNMGHGNMLLVPELNKVVNLAPRIVENSNYEDPLPYDTEIMIISADMNSDLSLLASWTISGYFRIGGTRTNNSQPMPSDPTLVETGSSKTSRLSLFFSGDQTTVRRFVSPITLYDLYNSTNRQTEFNGSIMGKCK